MTGEDPAGYAGPVRAIGARRVYGALDRLVRRAPAASLAAPLALLALLGSGLLLFGPSVVVRRLPTVPTVTIGSFADEAPERFVTPTILATRVVWDRTAVELAGAVQGRTVWYVVANTRGAGEYLRGRALLTDRKLLLAEGTLLAQVSVSIDPSWRHVWVMPDGPSGWIPAEFVAEMP